MKTELSKKIHMMSNRSQLLSGVAIVIAGISIELVAITVTAQQCRPGGLALACAVGGVAVAACGGYAIGQAVESNNSVE